MGKRGFWGLQRQYRKATRALQKHLITDFARAAPHKDIADTEVMKSADGADGRPHRAKTVRMIDA